MRKITLLFASLFLVMGSAWAQITSLADFKQDKCYTFSTPARGGWAVKKDGSQFASTNDCGWGTTVDATNKNQQFAVYSVNGTDYYLYSIGAGKFVKADRSLVDIGGDALEMTAGTGTNAGRARFNFRDYANSYINIGGTFQMEVNWWGTIDDGNAILVAEAGDLDAQLQEAIKAKLEEVAFQAWKMNALETLGYVGGYPFEYEEDINNASSLEEAAEFADTKIVMAAGNYYIKATGVGNDANWYLTSKTSGENSLLWAKASNELNEDYVWKLESVSDNEYKMQCASLGKYFQLKTATNGGDNNTYINCDKDNGDTFTFTDNGYGKFSIKNSKGENIRTEGDGQVNYWSGEANESWYLIPVVSEEPAIKLEELVITLPEGMEWIEPFTELNQTLQLGVEFLPEGANAEEITWTSSNENLITVSENGLIEVVGSSEWAEVIITATTASGVSASIEAYVMIEGNNEGEAAAYEVKLNKTYWEMNAVGETFQLAATAFVNETETVVDPETGESIDRVIQVPVEEEITFYWFCEGCDNGEVTVNMDGLVTVWEAFEGQVTITVKDMNGIASASCIILVDAVAEGGAAQLEELVLNTYFISEDKALKVDETFQLVVTFDPVEAAEELIWWSDDEDVLTVDENGLVKAVGAGDATIYVTTVSDYQNQWFIKGCTIYVVAGGETGIDAVEADAETVIYDLTGRRVEKMQKGIYIVNGKKVLVK